MEVEVGILNLEIFMTVVNNLERYLLTFMRRIFQFSSTTLHSAVTIFK